MDLIGILFKAKLDLKQDSLHDINSKIMNENNLIKWLCKAGKYYLYNIGIIIFKAIRKLPIAILITFLIQIKVLPLLIHVYFMKYYDIVLTSKMME